MRFGCQVHHRLGPEAFEQGTDRLTVGHVGLFEAVARRFGYLGDRLEVAGVGQLVDVEDLVVGLADQVRTSAEPMNPAPPVTRMRLLICPPGR